MLSSGPYTYLPTLITFSCPSFPFFHSITTLVCPSYVSFSFDCFIYFFCIF
jgi:hypothetical protein